MSTIAFLKIFSFALISVFKNNTGADFCLLFFLNSCKNSKFISDSFALKANSRSNKKIGF